MKIVAICGVGVGTSGILKVNAERVLDRLGLDADVTAADAASIAPAAADAQLLLASPGRVGRIGKTNPAVIVVQNYFDLDELEQKLDEALG